MLARVFGVASIAKIGIRMVGGAAAVAAQTTLYTFVINEVNPVGPLVDITRRIALVFRTPPQKLRGSAWPPRQRLLQLLSRNAVITIVLKRDRASAFGSELLQSARGTESWSGHGSRFGFQTWGNSGCGLNYRQHSASPQSPKVPETTPPPQPAFWVSVINKWFLSQQCFEPGASWFLVYADSTKFPMRNMCACSCTTMCTAVRPLIC